MSVFTILFVCTGNTCRSPMAEGIAQKWLDDHGHNQWIAISAGVSAAHGASTSHGTIEALAQRGIAFNGTSKLLTKEMVRSAHVVMCMSQSHLCTVMRYTNDCKKVGLLDPNGSIDDPIGLDQSVYDELADRMDEIIAQQLRSIVQNAQQE